jgi:lipopolysaccharide biosynthesis protein
MFGARTAALAPFFELGLCWEAPEPLPYDGTVLHAIERLVTLMARDRGFEIAAIHVPGSDDSGLVLLKARWSWLGRGHDFVVCP